MHACTCNAPVFFCYLCQETAFELMGFYGNQEENALGAQKRSKPLNYV